jgi:hypothetical protein
MTKGLVQGQRQVNQAADQRESREQGQLLSHAPAQPFQQALIQGVQTSQQCPGQKDGGAECQLEQAKPGLGDGVVRRFLMCGQRDLGAEGVRNGLAVQGHVANLARRQPEADQQADTQGGGERQCQPKGRGGRNKHRPGV